MRSRCPQCKQLYAVFSDGKLPRHHASRWSLNECGGSGKTPAEVVIAQAEREVSHVRSRFAAAKERIEDAQAVISRAESELAALPAEIAKAEKKLATLRKKLAAKGGAQ